MSVPVPSRDPADRLGTRNASLANIGSDRMKHVVTPVLALRMPRWMWPVTLALALVQRRFYSLLLQIRPLPLEEKANADKYPKFDDHCRLSRLSKKAPSVSTGVGRSRLGPSSM